MSEEPHPRPTSRSTKRQLLELALTDALTGLPNRRALDETLAQVWTHGRERHAPLCLAIADVDVFKDFNDRFGNVARQAAIRTVSTAMLG